MPASPLGVSLPDLCVRAFALLALTCAFPAHALPRYDAVRAQHVSTEAQLLDRNGIVIHEMRVDMSVRRLEWVALDAI
jgi:penicillin-binding protein 1C